VAEEELAHRDSLGVARTRGQYRKALSTSPPHCLSSEFEGTLIEHDEVDEFRTMNDLLFLGGGKRIFRNDPCDLPSGRGLVASLPPTIVLRAGSKARRCSTR
jgi:hypothetical protein